MKRLLLCACLGWALGVQDPGRAPGAAQSGADAAENAFVELSTGRSTYFVQEPIHLRLSFGFEERFLRSSMVQMFPQQLDVPAQVAAPWIEDLPGAIALGEEGSRPSAADPRPASFALNDGVAGALRAETRLVAGRPFAVFEIERSYLARSAGELSIPAPLLRFAHASRFEEDFVQGRRALDRLDESLSGAGLTLRVQPLPEEGRPPGFGGAVGSFALRAEAEPRDLELGQNLKLVLQIEGQGNLAYFDTPRLEDLSGFRLLGSIEETSAGLRRVTYDLEPLDEDVSEVPAIPFAFFDPGPPTGYRTVETRPISILVRPVSASTRDEGRVPSGAQGSGAALDGTPARPDPSGSSLRVLGWILALSLLAAVYLALRARRRAGRAAGHARASSSAAALRVRSAGDENPAEALAEFLAAHLGCPTPAVFGPDLRTRLLAAGVPAELVARSAARLDQLVAARFGGRVQPDSAESIRALVDELEHAFRTAEPPQTQ